MIKDLVRAVFPKSLRDARYERQLSAQFDMLRHEWLALPRSLGAVERSGGLGRILIFPGDPKELVGSVGDEAMITASIQTARSIDPDVQIYVLIDGERAAHLARERGMIPVDIWSRTNDFLKAFIDILVREHVDAVLMIGADIIDGVYGIVVPGRMIYAADVAARMGVEATVLGSSFNKRPRSELAQAFDDADPQVSFLLRDAPSHSRFSAFTKAQGVLVADSAFMLQSVTPSGEIADWISQKRKDDKKVVGFNIHPMLVKEDSKRVLALTNSAVSALSAVMSEKNLAIVLIPHDRRADVGDLVILNAIAQHLESNGFADDLLLIDAIGSSAAQLKGVAGALDGVITGRMHLAIGALGKGVPVLCVSYQDKFEGLFDHFHLPSSMLIEVPEASDPGKFATRLRSFVDEIPALREQVSEALPKVLAQSRTNFASLDVAANRSG